MQIECPKLTIRPGCSSIRMLKTIFVLSVTLLVSTDTFADTDIKVAGPKVCRDLFAGESIAPSILSRFSLQRLFRVLPDRQGIALPISEQVEIDIADSILRSAFRIEPLTREILRDSEMRHSENEAVFKLKLQQVDGSFVWSPENFAQIYEAYSKRQPENIEAFIENYFAEKRLGPFPRERSLKRLLSASIIEKNGLSDSNRRLKKGRSLLAAGKKAFYPEFVLTENGWIDFVDDSLPANAKPQIWAKAIVADAKTQFLKGKQYSHHDLDIFFINFIKFDRRHG